MPTYDASHQSSSNPWDEYDRRLPGLIAKVKADAEYHRDQKSHFLTDVNLSPPLGMYPQSVSTLISAHADDEFVYADEFGELILSKKGVMRLADVLGYSTQDSHRELNPAEKPGDMTWQTTVAYVNEYGDFRLQKGSYEFSLSAIANDYRLKLAKNIEWAKRTIGTDLDHQVKPAMKFAIKSGREAEWIEGQLVKEMTRREKYRTPLAESGALLRAIRNNGLQTSYTLEDFKRPFFGIRMRIFPGLGLTVQAQQQAERASSMLFAPTASPPSMPPAQQQAEPSAPAPIETKPDIKPTTKESIIADFDACDGDWLQQIHLVLELAKRNQYPAPLSATDMQRWTPAQLRSMAILLIDLGSATSSSGKGGQS